MQRVQGGFLTVDCKAKTVDDSLRAQKTVGGKVLRATFVLLCLIDRRYIYIYINMQLKREKDSAALLAMLVLQVALYTISKQPLFCLAKKD